MITLPVWLLAATLAGAAALGMLVAIRVRVQRGVDRVLARETNRTRLGGRHG